VTLGCALTRGRLGSRHYVLRKEFVSLDAPSRDFPDGLDSSDDENDHGLPGDHYDRCSHSMNGGALCVSHIAAAALVVRRSFTVCTSRDRH
jgi:hypothetical protein